MPDIPPHQIVSGTEYLTYFTSIEFAVMDGGITVDGSQGLRASFSITKFSRNEPLEEALTVSVTAKPTYAAHAPEWMTIRGS